MSNRKAIKSFIVLGCTGEPITSFISHHYPMRAKLYERFARRGIKLAPYDNFVRDSLRKEDMKVLEEDWFITFRYKGVKYRIEASAGTCWDGASVPPALVHGNVAKHTQKANIPALVHDFLFATKAMSFDDANNIFSGLLRWQDLNKGAIFQYMLGVRSRRGRKIYNMGNPEIHWMYDTCKMITIEEQ